MKLTNTSTRMILFPLAEGEEVVYGAVYEVGSTGATKVTTSPTSDIIGVAMGGDKIEKGKIMLDIDQTSIFEEAYGETAPEVGSYVLDCKLVLTVDTEKGTYTYILKKKETVE